MPTRQQIGVVLQGLGAAFNPQLAPLFSQQQEFKQKLEYQKEQDVYQKEQEAQAKLERENQAQQAANAENSKAKLGLYKFMLQNSDKFDQTTNDTIAEGFKKEYGIDVRAIPKTQKNPELEQLDLQQKQATLAKTQAQTTLAKAQTQKTLAPPAQQTTKISPTERMMNEYTALDMKIQNGDKLTQWESTRYPLLKNKLLPETVGKELGRIITAFHKNGYIPQQDQQILQIAGQLNLMKQIEMGIDVGNMGGMQGIPTSPQQVQGGAPPEPAVTNIDYGATPSQTIITQIRSGQITQDQVANDFKELLADPGNAPYKGQIIQKAKEIGINLQ